MDTRVGKYQAIRPIASGGMATVYLGRATGAGGFERLVAIKVMHAHIAADPDHVEMFLDEARLAARIRHPNVVPTLDVEEGENGCPYLVMEYIDGPTLSQVIKLARNEGGAMPIDVALRIVIDTLNGLHAAHELHGRDKEPLNLVHRDVSPQNVIVGRDGIARLTDFGVAKARVRIHSTRSTQMKGKLAYLAPEQLLDEPIDRRADVFAAGVVLWETLTGRRLFKADSEAGLVKKLIDGAKQPPSDVRRDVPRHIDAVCMKALSVHARDRYESAAAFADALEDAAMQCAVRVGNTRGVADYLKTLPIALPSASIPPPGEVTPTSLPSLSKPRVERTVDEGSADQTESGIAHTRDSVPAPPKRKPVLLISAAALVALLAVVAVVMLRPSAEAPAPAARASEPARAASAAATIKEVAPAVSATSAPSPSAPSTSAPSPSAPSPSAPSPSGSATASAEVRPVAPVTGPPTKWSPNKSNAKTHSDYRPSDL